MARVQVCDACGKPITKPVLKLFLTEVEQSHSRHHTSYTKHADIGECCADRFRRAVRWQTRKSKKPPTPKLRAVS